MGRLNDALMDGIDSFMDNSIGFIFAGLGLAIVCILVFVAVVGIKSCVAPTSVRTIVDKREQTVLVMVSTGKALVPIYSHEYILKAEAGYSCKTDAATYYARKVGDLHPCHWVR